MAVSACVLNMESGTSAPADETGKRDICCHRPGFPTPIVAVAPRHSRFTEWPFQ